MCDGFEDARGVALNIYCIKTTGYVTSLSHPTLPPINLYLPLSLQLLHHQDSQLLSRDRFHILRAHDPTARYVIQDGNKRTGAFTIYIEP